MTDNFSPPIGLRNKHVQTILASVGPRKRIVRQSFAEFKSDEQIMILNCHDGIRLSGVYNQARPCLLYTSPSPRDLSTSRMPSSA